MLGIRTAENGVLKLEAPMFGVQGPAAKAQEFHTTGGHKWTRI